MGASCASCDPSVSPPTATTCGSRPTVITWSRSGILQDHVDTTAYGGSSDATVKQAELQEVSPSGQLVWDWKTQDHISLAETGRWWPSGRRLWL